MPPSLSEVQKAIDEAWLATKDVPGHLQENEARFLGALAACVPASGRIVEIGSFKGRSTVMLAKVAKHFGFQPIVAIDPHTHVLTHATDSPSASSTYDEFLHSIRSSGAESHVEVHRALSKDVSQTWDQPIRLLWIDGDHSYAGVQTDFHGFARFVQQNGVIAMHDALNNFSGPIRVFVEQILRSGTYGPVGFIHSIAWGQVRPESSEFAAAQKQLERRARRLIPLVRDKEELRGLRKIRFKLTRSRVPRAPIPLAELTELLDPSAN